MSHIFAGRFTAQVEPPFVVFLIGMRVNRLLAVNKWGPTMMAMGPMLRTLYQHREKGFLGGETFLYWRGVGMIQYWQSFEDLERFAKNADDTHLPAWRRFNQAIGNDGSVGIWHETYVVEQGHYEAVYGNMPAFGLARATEHVSVSQQRETARRRLQQEQDAAI